MSLLIIAPHVSEHTINDNNPTRKYEYSEGLVYVGIHEIKPFIECGSQNEC